MKDYELFLTTVLPAVFVLRFALAMIRRDTKLPKVSTEKAADLATTLGEKPGPFQVIATWRDEQLQPLQKQLEVSSVEGQYAPESKSWIISHIMVSASPGEDPAPLGFWRLWQVEDPVTGEVAEGDDIHAFLLRRAGMEPGPYPFVFEAFEARIPSQPVSVTYSIGPDGPPRTVRGGVISVNCRNSSVEKVTVLSRVGGVDKRTVLVYGKSEILSLLPEGQEEPVEEPWEWFLRLGREWRSLDDRGESDAPFAPASSTEQQREESHLL
ncbi:hypothetical protein IAI18_13590 [Acetobacteraceae bacterium H6797]|nr:hypothetical protein [Acetobacteraceae bacterium H6797]